MSVHLAPPDSTTPSSGGGSRMLFFTLLAGMMFMQVFVTFRGLSSATAMDTAQLARELAAGNGLHTKVVVPYSWQQTIASGRGGSLAELQDVSQPPLPVLALAPPFRLLPRYWDWAGTSRVYLLDRVVAAVAVLFYVAALGLSYGTVRRLFDERIAGWMTVALLFCQPLWDVVRGGIAPAMMLCFCAMAFRCLASALLAQEENGRAGVRHALGTGMALALLAMTHQMALWLIAGFAFAWVMKIRPRGLVILLVLPAVLSLAGWGWRNMMVCGEPLGVGKATLQAALAFPRDTWLLRDFSGHVPDADFAFLMRKILANLGAQIQQLYTHLGSLVPAMLFFLALLHPFRDNAVSRMRWILFFVWIFAVAGMSVTGLPDEVKDDRQLHFLFLPLFTAFGFAFIAVLWIRLKPVHPHQGFWAKSGGAIIAVVLSALPMAQTLPVEAVIGLATKNRFAQWPPYVPDRIATLSTMTKPDEILFSDAPWAVAWYARRPSIWLPVKMEQFHTMRSTLQKQGASAAGIVLTPLSAKADVPGDLFRGEYAEWTAQIFRGYASAFGVDTQGVASDFPYREFHPLVGQPVSGRFIAEMVFLADRKRW